MRGPSERRRRPRIAAGAGLVSVLAVVILAAGCSRTPRNEAAPPPTTSPPATDPPLAPVVPADPPAAGRRARLAGVRTWSFALGVPVAGVAGAELAARLGGFDLVVVDGADVPADAVAALRAQGTIVLAYVNVGAIEQNRPWTAAAQPYRLDHWDQWDEWYADVGQVGFRELVTGTMVAPMLAKGVDGLFLDNVDMVDTHPAQRAAMVGLVADLAATVHARDGFLFAQNGEDATVDALVPYLDGWNREDVSFTYDDGAGRYVAVPRTEQSAALATLRRVRSRGVLVTTVDYLDDATGAGADAEAARQAACGAGAVPAIGDIGLTGTVPPRPC